MNPKISNGWFRAAMPYCFRRMRCVVQGQVLPHVWLPLNRDYKPLGVTTSRHTDYADYIGQAISFARDPSKFKNVWWNNDTAVSEVSCFLYSDLESSRDDYFDRLNRLMEHSHKTFKGKDDPYGGRWGQLLYPEDVRDWDVLKKTG